MLFDQIMWSRTRVKTKVDANMTTLPHFHSYHTDTILSNVQNAQLMPKPSDITFIMRENDFILLGEQFKKLGIPFKLRKSRQPLKSISVGYKNNKYWLFSTKSLMAPRIAYALLKIKVKCRRGQKALITNTLLT